MEQVNSPSTHTGAIKFSSAANAVLGLWLIVCSWIVGYSLTGMLWDNIIVGAVVLILAVTRLSARTRAGVPSWLNALLGAWLIIAPFVISTYDAGERWNSIIVGILVVVFSLASGTAGATRRTTT